MLYRRLALGALAFLAAMNSSRADSLLLNVATDYALTPGRANADGSRAPVMRALNDGKDQPRHRWVFVKTAKGYLIKNADSGLTLVPVPDTRNDRHGKLMLVKVKGEGQEQERWQFTKTKHGYLIQNVESGMSLVPIREEAGAKGGRLVLFRVEDEMNEGGLPDQNWKIVTFGPEK